MSRFEEALAAWPKAERMDDGGIRITGAYEQPTFGNQTGGALLFIFAVVAFAGLRLESWLAALMVFIVGVVIWSKIGVSMFGRKLDIRVYPDRIEIPARFGISKRYARELPMEFRIEQHQKAFEEERKEQRSRKRQPRTYRDAIEVVLQYGEKRVVLAEMLQKHVEMARALVIRLQNVCASVDLSIASAQDTGAQRESEFGPAPDVR